MELKYDIYTLNNAQGTGEKRQYVRIVQHEPMTPAFGGFKKVVPLLTSMGLPAEKKLRLIWRIRYSMKG